MRTCFSHLTWIVTLGLTFSHSASARCIPPTPDALTFEAAYEIPSNQPPFTIHPKRRVYPAGEFTTDCDDVIHTDAVPTHVSIDFVVSQAPRECRQYLGAETEWNAAMYRLCLDAHSARDSEKLKQ